MMTPNDANDGQLLFELSISPTSLDMRHARLAHARRFLSDLDLILVCALPLFLFASNAFANPFLRKNGFWIGMVILILWLVVLPLSRRWYVGRRRWPTQVWRFTTAGASVAQDGHETFHQWSDYTGFAESSHVFLLRRGRDCFDCIPKRYFESRAQRREFGKMLRTYTANNGPLGRQKGFPVIAPPEAEQ